MRPLLEVFSEAQVKKGQIFKFVNMDKKGAYLDQFLLRNLIVSFVFTYNPHKLQKSQLKSDVIHWFNFRDKNSPFGVKN